ncbi:ABC transporter substrate-binding protein [Conexibacter woesei]|uniref:Extracellular solute-binding protein family 3 n=1 Tax=Conexibacter woesei (strain DSM 14684 / CCUG 47730 / CIP 108061 / JCM 11494 / NBRC 100937 / ID131577) TaxID=469383 RepID=D3FD05_CONWI|nr:ABC transporter substrate-binding protein [Conexibacter woesei]ADB51517.1 extracellular solute-binding protein family 3 [Conexibacter woesei DSM 14684]
MRPSRRHVIALLAAAALPLTLAACGSDDDADSGSTATTGATTAANACEKANLQLLEDGQLTVATDKPAYPPYFEDDDPSNGRGFESAVAFAIARQLGFARDEVKWVIEPFNSSYAPGPKRFDFDVNQISITPQRERAVDFSAPYYTAPQAVVALKDSDAARATSLDQLKDVQLGVQIGTTSLDAADAQIDPSKQPKVFNDSNDVVRALKQGQVDAVVVDLPTAFYLTAAQVPEAAIVGQFEAPGGDAWGALLARDSSLTACVSDAIETLRADGTLDRLEQRWMGEAAGAPALQ